MALNKSCIGREYPAVETRVTREAIRDYALACNDDNPRYLDPAIAGGIVAPPLFGVTVTWESLLRASGDPEVGVDVMRLLHGEQDMEFAGPIRPDDLITSRSRIALIETRATGEALDIELTAHNQHRDPVLRAITGIFIRGARRERSAPVAGAAEPTRPAGEPLLVTSQTIDRDQTVRYAQASGDRNPIHVDENVARMVGLPGIVVHGLCTMAFVARVMVDGLCDRDPARLKLLRVRFARPVFPGQTINTLVWSDGEHAGRPRYAFETYNPDGQAVIRGGIAEIARAQGRTP
ncbi:MAG TPA: MaoC/PaaZ C-terminal domain-containing protein [Candidatus Binataceae bacterium]|nr:MaoC/PaaZ C-terminal domain-containing protein [Candidatus Binataceae bacterium]